MSEIWLKYRATVRSNGEVRMLPVQAMSVHEAPDHARFIAGFEFGWDPSGVEVLKLEPDESSDHSGGHVHAFEVTVRSEGGEPEIYKLKARDAECAEALAVLHCADRTGLDPREVDILSVTRT
ncbi:hypothetical protein H2509_19020 [Stappia sp. F7233]|uniref:Uncharacterized protein n=1 Tax=Stappia albiluteola TaxID=2758565 RepID=A0A839AJH6_9HYPH|nr:hypothetical protein [Stappia albiluteola]MBA5779226.1 hypothetical protein [Stappia albiluteola]